VLLVGLTGGIGSGKSTVADMLAARGAVVIDADELARKAVEPGTHGYAEVIRRFGPPSLQVTGELDREWLAGRVFSDPEARAALESIIHPEVARLFAEAVEPHRDTDAIVVYVVPLLVENRLEKGFDLVVVVTASEDVRVSRVAAAGRLTAEEIHRRIEAQASDEERERVADVVIRNEGSMSDLSLEVESLWGRLRSR
jgi:dephospho-CoA kinase